MRQKIPEKIIVNCDLCGCEIKQSPCNPLPGIKVTQSAFDMYGLACADGSYNLDTCYKCLGKIEAFIDSIKSCH